MIQRIKSFKVQQSYQQWMKWAGKIWSFRTMKGNQWLGHTKIWHVFDSHKSSLQWSLKHTKDCSKISSVVQVLISSIKEHKSPSQVFFRQEYKYSMQVMCCFSSLQLSYFKRNRIKHLNNHIYFQRVHVSMPASFNKHQFRQQVINISFNPISWCRRMKFTPFIPIPTEKGITVFQKTSIRSINLQEWGLKNPFNPPKLKK